MHDTIYIHDTIYVPQEGIGGADAVPAKIYSSQGRIVVESGDGMPLPDVRIYDAVGRQMSGSRKDESGRMELPVPASGVYMVKIGDRPARRIVVIR